MVREKNVEKFHKYFVDLWTFLKKIYNDDSSEKDYLNKIYMKHHRMDKVTYLEQVLTNISPYIDYISKKDEFIFLFFPFMYGIYPYAEVTEKQKQAMSDADVPFKYLTIYEITYKGILQFLK